MLLLRPNPPGDPGNSNSFPMPAMPLARLPRRGRLAAGVSAVRFDREEKARMTISGGGEDERVEVAGAGLRA
jgi:hypothetical protein